jgi:hypothetical protein
VARVVNERELPKLKEEGHSEETINLISEADVSLVFEEVLVFNSIIT